MAGSLTIAGDGVVKIDGRAYRIPARFSAREIYSYRRLLEPIPDTPGGTSLSGEQRRRQTAYFLRRAAACVIPGLEASELERLPYQSLQTLHTWLWRHRPELALRASRPAG